MKSPENCGVCGKPLVYASKSVDLRCDYCGLESASMIYCPDGHYVCDACHKRAAIGVLRQVLACNRSTEPAEILEKVMAYPSVSMHGPEHHAMVPAIIVAAVKNAGYPVPEDAVETAIKRGERVPGGWCGFYGACGAAIGVGIAVSVLTGATPLTGKTRGLANEATACALRYMTDSGPRCCKRASRRALAAATAFLKERMDIEIPAGTESACVYPARNRECILDLCPYYRKAA